MVKEANPYNLAIAQNGMESWSIFNFRKYWKTFSQSSVELDETADLWYDKKLFGKLNNDGDIIHLSETNLKEYRNTDEVIMGVDFVVDAFSALQSHFLKANAGQLLNLRGEMDIVRMHPKKGWTGIHQAYNEFLMTFYDMLVTDYFHSLPSEKQIVDLESYVKAVVGLFSEYAGEKPILSQSGLILSNMFPTRACGLIVEISEKRHDFDPDKYSWTQDLNYDFYKSAAMNHGFVLDANAPWRLIADIQHPVMARFMGEYGVTAENLFETYYYQSYRFDMDNLRDFFVNSYNTYCQSYPVFLESKPCLNIHTPSPVSTTKIIEHERIAVDPDLLEDTHPEPLWLEICHYIRLRELGVKFTPASFNRQVKEIIQIYNRFGLDNAKEYANMLIKKNKLTIF